jgi:hypothetical protein
MQPTPYADANRRIAELLMNIQSILGEKLVGLYLDGSLVLGDFDPRTSDIDLVAALAADLDEPEFAALQAMHEQFARDHPAWDDRIEVCYIGVEILKEVKSRTGPIANISPGEPFHRTEARQEWVMNWYLTRERGKTIFGPSPRTIIEPISREDFIRSVKDHARAWEDWVEGMKNRYAQSYAILALCRALHAVRTGEQVSKKQAGEWAKGALPEWADVIQNALDWKEAGKSSEPDEEHFPRTVAFVQYVRQMILEA